MKNTEKDTKLKKIYADYAKTYMTRAELIKKFTKEYKFNTIDDDVSNVIDYISICDEVNKIFIKRCKLMETLIDNIKKHLENKYIGVSFQIEITKETYSTEHSLEKIKIKNI